MNAPRWRVPRLESKEYTDWVKSKPCQCCGYTPPEGEANDPHHRIGGRVAAYKVDDFETMSLCRRCHDELHALGESGEAWERKHGLNQRELALDMLLLALREEVLLVDKKAARYIGGF